MHHPFTSPLKDDIDLLNSNPEKVRANAYDLVINGIEIGGGSIRIHERDLQEKVFETLGFTKEEANNQFGFLLDAFKYDLLAEVYFGWSINLFGKESIKISNAFKKHLAEMYDKFISIDGDQQGGIIIFTFLNSWKIIVFPILVYYFSLHLLFF